MLRRTKSKIEKMFVDACSEFIQTHILQYHATSTYRTCETCGCLVDSTKAIKGDSFVKSEKITICCSVGTCESTKEKIYTPYYCLTHAPKICKSEKPIEDLYS